MNNEGWRFGVVLHFCNKSGEGVLTDFEDGFNYYVSYKAIRSNARFKTLTTNSNVRFKLESNSSDKIQVSLVEEIRRIR